jgi:carbon storage regulator CsrA
MLVLSRKPKEKIVLPTLHTAIQVLEIKRGVVRLGIEAPPEVSVLREEVADRTAQWSTPPTCPKEQITVERKQDPFRRQLCEKLRTTGCGLGLVRLQLDAGLLEEAAATLARIQADFQVLRYGVEGEMEDSPAPAPAKARKQKALLVEDNHNERELLAGFLRRSGLDVATAGDGLDALEYLRRHGKPDVVLLDMGLPRVDGPTVVRQLRCDQAYTGLKIFGVTGHLPDEFQLDRGPSGIDHWFQKPLDPTALLNELTKELDESFHGI